jgi:hypothetical protein
MAPGNLLVPKLFRFFKKVQTTPNSFVNFPSLFCRRTLGN